MSQTNGSCIDQGGFTDDKPCMGFQTPATTTTTTNLSQGGFLDDIHQKPTVYNTKEKPKEIWVPNGKGGYEKRTTGEAKGATSPVSGNLVTVDNKGDYKVNSYTTRRKDVPELRFTPYAWAKLCFLRDIGLTEVGGYLVAAADDPMLIEDFQMPKQTCNSAFTKFDPMGIAKLTEQLFDEHIHPSRYCNRWAHTHPANSATPSGVDEDCFIDTFGEMEWAIMFILARGGEIYCRMRYNKGPGFAVYPTTRVDWSVPFPGTDYEGWKAEYGALVNKEEFRSASYSTWESKTSYNSNSSSQGSRSTSMAKTDGKGTYWWEREHEEDALVASNATAFERYMFEG